MILTLLFALLAQLIPGLWFLDNPIEYKGLVEEDAITFSIPVDRRLPSGSFVQFGVCLENTGEKAPRHYMVEVQEGGEWRCLSSKVFYDGVSSYSFVTAESDYRHPTVYQDIFRLRRPAGDSLRVRCRVCSPYATDNSLLSAKDPENTVTVKSRCYVGALLQPLGSKVPAKRIRVLLMGNSFTYFYGEPLILQAIAFSQGYHLDVRTSLKGGQTFRDHTKLPMSLNSLSADVYSYAFLQGQSQEPARLAADTTAGRDVRIAFTELCDALRSSSPACNIYVENTWAYEGSEFGGFGSLEEFDRLLAEGSAMLAAAGNCKVSPVGQAFAKARTQKAASTLYDTDAKHPGLAGAYLKACVTYLVISGKPFYGEVPSCGLPEDEAAKLRTIAESIFK